MRRVSAALVSSLSTKPLEKAVHVMSCFLYKMCRFYLYLLPLNSSARLAFYNTLSWGPYALSAP